MLLQVSNIPEWDSLKLDKEAGDGKNCSMARRQMYGFGRNVANIPLAMRCAKLLSSFHLGLKNSAPPAMIAWELTNKCNCSCGFCDTHNLNSSQDELPMQAQLEIAEKIGKAGVGMVTISGGEPLLSESLAPVVKRLAGYSARVSICTNGSRLVETCGALADAGAESLTIGLNSADPSTHDEIQRMKGSYENVESAVERIKSNQKTSKLIVRVRMLVTGANYREMVPFARYWRDKVDEVCFQPVQDLGEGHVHHGTSGDFLFEDNMRGDFLHCMGELVSTFPEYNNPYYKLMADFLFNPCDIKNSFRCVIPALGFRLSPNGDVTLCSDPSVVTGNLFRQSLDEAWNGPGFSELRKRSRNKQRECLCWIQPMRLNFMLRMTKPTFKNRG